MGARRSLAGLAIALALACPPSHAAQPSAVQAGCYATSDQRCHVRAAPFVVIADTGQPLRRMQLRLNGVVAYDFATDVSNPPTGAYAPSAVALDFAARCGETYVVTVAAQDGDDLGIGVVGQTQPFTCPATPVDGAAIFADGFEEIPPT